MIRCGQLCSACSSECKDKDQKFIECPGCSGKGCEHCSDGMMEITGCPNAEASKVYTAIECIELFDEGLPPIAGGTLDQAASFIHAARFYNRVKARLKNDE